MQVNKLSPANNFWPNSQWQKQTNCVPVSAERAVTVPLSVEACVSAVELSAASGSGSFRAAFLAECLCFANLTLSFLEVLILARRSNKEPSEYTV